MATAVEQQHCDRCQARLRRNASYCEECGQRTRRSRRLIRLAIRIEILAVIITAVVVLGFAYIYYRP